VLRHGRLIAPLHLDDRVVVLARHDAGTWAITATNNGAKAQTVTLTLPAGMPLRGWRDALTHASVRGDLGEGGLTIVVPPRFGTVLVSHART
jgi:cyclomaltodextrinase / maltogenic alpha-amylase / neopullulanase